MCIWCMQCLRAHARMYCAKKRREKKNCWPCACEQDSTEGERKPLIATHMHRLLWLSLNVCIEREIPESYDFFFAQVISCLRAALLRILCFITDMAAVCLCALHYFLPEKCIEISEMHPYRHLHRLWNTCGRQCSYFLSRHGCLTSPALPSRWVFSSVWPRGHSRWCCWVCYLLHLNSQHALLYETGWDASRQEVVEKLV